MVKDALKKFRGSFYERRRSRFTKKFVRVYILAIHAEQHYKIDFSDRARLAAEGEDYVRRYKRSRVFIPPFTSVFIKPLGQTTTITLRKLLADGNMYGLLLSAASTLDGNVVHEQRIVKPIVASHADCVTMKWAVPTIAASGLTTLCVLDTSTLGAKAGTMFHRYYGIALTD